MYFTQNMPIVESLEEYELVSSDDETEEDKSTSEVVVRKASTISAKLAPRASGSTATPQPMLPPKATETPIESDSSSSYTSESYSETESGSESEHESAQAKTPAIKAEVTRTMSHFI